MKKTITILAFIIFLITSVMSKAATYTSSHSGDWTTGSTWIGAVVPTSGASPASQNIIVIQAGHTVTIDAVTITLSNVVVYVYGTLRFEADFPPIPAIYGRLLISGTGAGVIIQPGGRLDENVLDNNEVYIRVNGTTVWDGSDGDLSAGASQIALPASVNNPLPVIFTAWEVFSSHSGLKASWTTCCELNNEFFTIEESADGKNFYTIAEVASYGDATTLQYYSYEFTSEGKGTLYYRLKQTDHDGTSTYSEIISVSTSASAALEVYPNPVTQNQFSVFAGENVLNTISLLDPQTGQEIFHQEFSFGDSGAVSVSLPENVKAGIYLLNVTHSAGTETRSLVVY